MANITSSPIPKKRIEKAGWERGRKKQRIDKKGKGSLKGGGWAGKD